MIWRKSSYSVDGDSCVEIAPIEHGVAVRDSKNMQGPTLAFPERYWRTFVRAVS